MLKAKMQGGLKGFLIKPPFLKRLFLMLIGVIVMGICVSVLKLTNFGTDPCSATNYGLCKLTGLSFGTIQVITATIYFLIVICFDYSKLGLGTIGNMLIVGYTADFTTYFINNVLKITAIDSFTIRLVVMFVTVALFVVAVALYINAGLGASAYDVLPNIIYDKVTKNGKNKKIPYKVIRMGFDLFFTIMGFVLKGEAGVITILMMLSLGPIIEYVSKIVGKLLKIDEAAD